MEYNAKRKKLVQSILKTIEVEQEYVISWHYRFDWMRDIANKMVRKGVLRKVSKRGLDTYTKGVNFHLATTFN